MPTITTRLHTRQGAYTFSCAVVDLARYCSYGASSFSTGPPAPQYLSTISTLRPMYSSGFIIVSSSSQMGWKNSVLRIRSIRSFGLPYKGNAVSCRANVGAKRGASYLHLHDASSLARENSDLLMCPTLFSIDIIDIAASRLTVVWKRPWPQAS